jgi:hypothetical protein
MQMLIGVYEHNKMLIEKFLLSNLHKQRVNKLDEKSVGEMMALFPSLEAVYASDKAFVRQTPLYLRHGKDERGQEVPIPSAMELEGFDGTETIIPPYLSSATGYLVVTAVLASEEGYRFFDFSLRALLERLGLVPGHRRFTLFSRGSYLLMGATLIFFALFSVVYGLGSFVSDLFIDRRGFSFETIFKPVIAVTLGLAFFDLGKTIINHEVFRSSETLEAFDAKSFITFLTSIMIALFIETLLSLFKATLSGFGDMLYVSALIASLALLFFVFSHFVKGVGIWNRK